MILNTFLTSFWNPYIWLPPGTHWSDIVNKKTRYPVPSDLLYQIPLAISMVCARLIVESLVFYPLGQYFGLKLESKKPAGGSEYLPAATAALEKAYRNTRGRIAPLQLEQLAKKTDRDVRHVQRWMRKRRARDKTSSLVKFSESGWRGLCYLCFFILGVYVLWDKPWLWDLSRCWQDFPYHDMTDDIWWYYLLGTSYNLSMLITIAFDTKRKDFWEMFLHHVVTIGLYNISWFSNLIRCATLTALIHDFADIFLESAKMCDYIQYDGSKNVLFALLLLAWVPTRLIMFPKIIYSGLTEGLTIFPPFPACYLITGMSMTLVVLHLFWSFLLLKILLRAFNSGQCKDARSCSESGSDENGAEGSEREEIKNR